VNTLQTVETHTRSSGQPITDGSQAPGDDWVLGTSVVSCQH